MLMLMSRRGAAVDIEASLSWGPPLRTAGMLGPSDDDDGVDDDDALWNRLLSIEAFGSSSSTYSHSHSRGRDEIVIHKTSRNDDKDMMIEMMKMEI